MSLNINTVSPKLTTLVFPDEDFHLEIGEHVNQVFAKNKVLGLRELTID